DCLARKAKALHAKRFALRAKPWGPDRKARSLALGAFCLARKAQSLAGRVRSLAHEALGLARKAPGFAPAPPRRGRLTPPLRPQQTPGTPAGERGRRPGKDPPEV